LWRKTQQQHCGHPASMPPRISCTQKCNAAAAVGTWQDAMLLQNTSHSKATAELSWVGGCGSRPRVAATHSNSQQSQSSKCSSMLPTQTLVVVLRLCCSSNGLSQLLQPQQIMRRSVSAVKVVMERHGPRASGQSSVG
jgi:hypothetical protein